jgi:hypothetical protein
MIGLSYVTLFKDIEQTNIFLQNASAQKITLSANANMKIHSLFQSYSGEISQQKCQEGDCS